MFGKATTTKDTKSGGMGGGFPPRDSSEGVERSCDQRLDAGIPGFLFQVLAHQRGS
jgi:hypothetical protein